MSRQQNRRSGRRFDGASRTERTPRCNECVVLTGRPPTAHLRPRRSRRSSDAEHDSEPADRQVIATLCGPNTVGTGGLSEVVALKVGGSSPLGHPKVTLFQSCW